MRIILSDVAARASLAIRSIKFWLAAAIYLLLLIFYSYTGQIYQTQQGIYYLLHYSLSNGTREFSLMACAMPAAGIFAEEWCNGKFVFSYTRAKKLEYAFSIILASFLIAAMVCIISCSIYRYLFIYASPYRRSCKVNVYPHGAKELCQRRTYAQRTLFLILSCHHID